MAQIQELFKSEVAFKKEENKEYLPDFIEHIQGASYALARKIATDCISANIVTLQNEKKDEAVQNLTKEYLLAGSSQYRTLWARDLAMSVLGALHIGQKKAVKDSLEAFFFFQREDGLFPRVIDNRSMTSRVILGILGMPPDFRYPLKGGFITENNVISIDGNLMIVWAVSEYVQKTGDVEFAKTWFSKMELAVSFIEKNYFLEGLIGNQPPFSDWADSIRRTGRVSFTNIFYILALRGLASISGLLNFTDKKLYYKAKTAQVVAAFMQCFWLPEEKFLRNFEGDTQNMAADANLLAVAFNIIPPAQAAELMDRLRKSPLWSPIPGRPAWPDYPSSLKSILVKCVNLAGYHDSSYWLWITSLAACAEYAVGNLQGYYTIMDWLSEKIATDGAIHEVYDLKNSKQIELTPVNRLFYRAEAPFTWSAALYLQADSCQFK
jgi:glycogen debranching enzyme